MSLDQRKVSVKVRSIQYFMCIYSKGLYTVCHTSGEAHGDSFTKLR